MKNFEQENPMIKSVFYRDNHSNNLVKQNYCGQWRADFRETFVCVPTPHIYAKCLVCIMMMTGISLHVYFKLGKMVIFMILILPIYEHLFPFIQLFIWPWTMCLVILHIEVLHTVYEYILYKLS